MRLMRRRNPEQSPPLRPIKWVSLEAGDAGAHPGLINDIMAKRVDGMSVRGMFDPASIDHALQMFEAMDDDWTAHPFGSLLGMPLNMIGANSRDRTPYLDDAERFRPVLRDGFGFDPHQRMIDVLRPMSGDLEIVSPTEDGREYSGGNIRRYEPGRGGLKTHAGNEFNDLLKDGAMSHLLTTTLMHDHMSYFVILQEPEVGGELSVFDLLWGEEPTQDEKWYGFRDDSSFESVSMLRIPPVKGELVMFGGGWRWHRVDEISGRKARITYGGFAAPRIDGQAIHLFN